MGKPAMEGNIYSTFLTPVLSPVIQSDADQIDVG